MCAKIAVSGPSRKIEPQQVKKIVALLCEQVGVPADEAAVVGDSMMQAHLRGIDTHGIRALPNYIKRFKAGSLNAAPNMRIERETAVSAAIDADNALGHIAGAYAMQIAISKAKKSGIGIVTVRNSNHFGACAFFSMMAQEEGFIGFSCTNCSARLAPTGGKTACYGNDPWSVAIPHSEGEVPVVIDMANSVVANSNINIAKKMGVKIPLTWALTAEGLPTDDPNQAKLLQPIAGYKGYALSLAVEAMAGGLSGAALSNQAGEYNSMKDGQNLGHLFMAIDPELFVGREEYVRRMENFFETVKSSELAEGSKGVWLPGEMEYEKYCRNLNGIEIPEQYLNDLNVLCEEFGLKERI